MHLFEWGTGWQRHFVVAPDFAKAEQAIKAEFPDARIEKLVDLGPYVIVWSAAEGEGESDE
jgi:hypothetical protein